MNFFTKRKLKKNSNYKGKDLRTVNGKTPWYKPVLLMMPAIIIIIIFTIIPFIYTVKDGFHYKAADSDPWAQGKLSFDTFSQVAQDPLFIKGLKNSIYYALIAVPLILVISAFVSSAISSVLRKKMRGILQTIFFLPYVTSAIAISLAFAFMFDMDTGLLNKIMVACGGHKMQWLQDSKGSTALISMIIYGVWRGLAFNILIFTTAMLGVDKTLYKAASIDGASQTKQFFRITLPSIKRTTNFLVIMGIIGAVKVFPLALFNNNTETAKQYGGYTLMLYIYANIHLFPEKAGVASIYLLGISISYSIVVKGGFNQVIKFGEWLGEKRVSNKINH